MFCQNVRFDFQNIACVNSNTKKHNDIAIASLKTFVIATLSMMHDDIQRDGILHNVTQPNNIHNIVYSIYNIHYSNTKHNDAQHIVTHHNDCQASDILHSSFKHNDGQHNCTLHNTFDNRMLNVVRLSVIL